ncbi:MAG: hypothetical protein GQ571_06705 [Desulfobacterales bacterium]|nr:hypothetical protein [Desulfobacterales bacterium]
MTTFFLTPKTPADQHINKKRKALGIDKARDRVLMDMSDRREIDAAYSGCQKNVPVFGGWRR